jgi:urease subunit alpha
LKLSREKYFQLYGPTTGDSLRLGDSNLWLEVERDIISSGDELVFGAGKPFRDGIGMSPTAKESETLDLVITNAVVCDPTIGVVKADIGIKNRYSWDRARGQPVYYGRCGFRGRNGY